MKPLFVPDGPYTVIGPSDFFPSSCYIDNGVVAFMYKHIYAGIAEASKQYTSLINILQSLPDCTSADCN